LNLYSTPVLQATSTCFAPVLSTVTPNQVLLHSPDQTIALSGSNFVPDSKVDFDGQALDTTFIDPSDLTAVVPAIDLEQNGAFPITVNSPDNPGGTTSPVLFQVGGVTVTLSANSATVPVGASQLFTAKVEGTTNTAVNWSVNGVAGGNSTVGSITAEGVYKAPSTVPNPSAVTITATSQDDSFDSDSASVTISTASPTYFVGEAFVSPDGTVCDYPAPWTQATPPCLTALQSGTSTADLNVATNGASAAVQFDGSNYSVGASTTSSSTDNRADAVGSGSYNYVLTSTTIAAGTPLTLTVTIPRSGSLSVDASQGCDASTGLGCGDVTAQDTLMINIGMNGALALSNLNQAERVNYPSQEVPYGSEPLPATESSLADSSVFTFGLSGNTPVLLSEPNIINFYAQQGGAATGLGDLTVNFTVSMGQPFGVGLYDHVNTHGGNTGDGVSTGVISAPQFDLPSGVVLHNQ
jgi:hypothetical protein